MEFYYSLNGFLVKKSDVLVIEYDVDLDHDNKWFLTSFIDPNIGLEITETNITFKSVLNYF